MKTIVQIDQGGMLRLDQQEAKVVDGILRSQNRHWSGFSLKDGLVKFPQQFVGHIGLPHRTVVIRPKHAGVTLNHVLRLYFFLHSSDSSDIDNPMYDVDSGNDLNLQDAFVRELLVVVRKGVPVEYIESTMDLPYVRGKVNLVRTALGLRLKQTAPFNVQVDDLTRDTPINRVLVAAARKLESRSQNPDIRYALQQTGSINYSRYPESVVFTKNTAHCQKAVSLAYLVLRDLTISTGGESASGESILIDFDRLFEDFIKKIIIEFSNAGDFSYWTYGRFFGNYNSYGNTLSREYMPDLLHGFREEDGVVTASAVLDMKNKTSEPFHNSDIYQMAFYGQMLKTKKILLCYPSSGKRTAEVFFFDDPHFYLHKIRAVFFNMLGNTAGEFKKNIRDFVNAIDYQL